MAIKIKIPKNDDKPGKTIRRVYRFLAMGVSIVWVLDPEDRTLDVFRRGQPPVELSGDQEVTGEDVLPDLRCKVADFFAMPGE